ncbi:hypothetical protein BZL30_9232 [Mycobacterium kansasii]|uniref:Uncharacterized protein n=1 Tax=Mycobacterium kansasii TaxID=1768 RepID=A0A1V3WBB4_MYCKA|nr:hypothetical protein BZL30_9232 [Mycobacterium kansasii]
MTRPSTAQDISQMRVVWDRLASSGGVWVRVGVACNTRRPHIGR